MALSYYTVQLRLTAPEQHALPQLSSAAREAAQALTAEGTPVRFVRAIFVPEDGACFHLYEAESVDAVVEAADRAGLSVDRPAPAVRPSHGCPGGR